MKKTNEIAIIFDLDDTLIACNVYYMQARKMLAEKITNLIPEATTEEVIKLLQEIDHGNVGSMNLNALRFPYTLAKTYQEIAEKYNGYFDPEIATECFNIGMFPITQIPTILPGIEEMLSKLQSSNLYILTGGSPGTQRGKLVRTGLIKYFREDHIFVSEQKTDKEMAEVIELIKKEHGFSEEDIFMVGDSLTVDVQTALNCGIQPVHIQTATTWSYLNGHVSGSFKSVTSTLEAIEYILNKENVVD